MAGQLAKGATLNSGDEFQGIPVRLDFYQERRLCK